MVKKEGFRCEISPFIPLRGKRQSFSVNILSEIVHFLYPCRCEVCGRLLADGEKIICVGCLLGLPRTNYHRDLSNPVAMLFWGRVYITYASSWYHFSKGSPYSGLIHKLKYEGRKDIGSLLGCLYANELKGSVFTSADLIVPVPLHPSREKVRGYNQSMIIAGGLGRILGIPVRGDVLVRRVSTDTQTRKSRFDRFLNMEGKFRVTNPEVFLSRHVLLVDDVVTTGSTLEACAYTLLEAGCGAVSILTLAVA